MKSNALQIQNECKTARIYLSSEEIISNITKLEKITPLSKYITELNRFLNTLEDDCFSHKIIEGKFSIIDKKYLNFIHFGILEGCHGTLAQMARLTPTALLEDALLELHKAALEDRDIKFHLSLFKLRHSDNDLLVLFKKIRLETLNLIASTYISKELYCPEYRFALGYRFNFIDLMLLEERSITIIDSIMEKLTTSTLNTIINKTPMITLQIPARLIKDETSPYLGFYKCVFNINYTFNESTLHLIKYFGNDDLFYLLKSQRFMLEFLRMFNTKLLNNLIPRLAKYPIASILRDSDAFNYLTEENKTFVVSQSIGAFSSPRNGFNKDLMKTFEKIEKHAEIANVCYYILLNQQNLGPNLLFIILQYYSLNDCDFLRTQNKIRSMEIMESDRVDSEQRLYTKDGWKLLKLLATYIKPKKNYICSSMADPSILVMSYLYDSDIFDSIMEYVKPNKWLKNWDNNFTDKNPAVLIMHYMDEQSAHLRLFKPGVTKVHYDAIKNLEVNHLPKSNC